MGRRKTEGFIACNQRKRGNEAFLNKARAVPLEKASKGVIPFAFVFFAFGKEVEMRAAVATILGDRSTGGFLNIIPLLSF